MSDDSKLLIVRDRRMCWLIGIASGERKRRYFWPCHTAPIFWTPYEAWQYVIKSKSATREDLEAQGYRVMPCKLSIAELEEAAAPVKDLSLSRIGMQ